MWSGNFQIIIDENAGFETRQIVVPKEEAGKIWKAEVSGNFNYSFLSIPDRYLLLEKLNDAFRNIA